jgi:hypothetical protein
MSILNHLHRLLNPVKTLTALALGLGAVTSQATVSYVGGTYSQNFDSLATSGTSNPFVSNSTLPGWYIVNGDSLYGGTGPFTLAFPASPVATPNYRAGNGSSNTGAIYSFGTGTEPDRALGSVGSGTPD